MKMPNIILFSSVQMEYVLKLDKLSPYPVKHVYSLSEQDYRRLAAGGLLDKIWLRTQMYVLYPFKLFFVSFFVSRDDILLVTSNPFFSPLAAWLGSRRTKPLLVHWRCDLYPDALVVAGTIKAGGFVEYFIGLVQRSMNKTCDRLVSVGDYLRVHGEHRWGRAQETFYIDNVPSDEAAFSSELSQGTAGLGFHYGGQLGYMHEPDSLLEFVKAAKHLSDGTMRFDFRVSGAYRKRFEGGLSAIGLSLSGPIANAEWKILIRDFHVGLVSLSPGGATVSLPSKIYSMMAGGLAIVAVCPAWSDLAKIIQENKCGWVINNSPFTERSELEVGDYSKNVEAKRDLAAIRSDAEKLVRELQQSPEILDSCRRRAVETARTKFGVGELRRLWRDALRPRDQSA